MTVTATAARAGRGRALRFGDAVAAALARVAREQALRPVPRGCAVEEPRQRFARLRAALDP